MKAPATLPPDLIKNKELTYCHIFPVYQISHSTHHVLVNWLPFYFHLRSSTEDLYKHLD